MGTDTTRPAAACPEGRYTRLPDALLAELTPREHQLVHLLLSYRWTDDAQIYPYVGTLAKRLDCSKRTIQRTLSALVERGYIVVAARYRDESDGEHHGQTSNVYAPGPMLLPLLPRDRDEGDGPSGQARQHPVTRTADTRKYRNEKPQRRYQNGRYTPPSEGSDYLETRYGRLKMRT